MKRPSTKSTRLYFEFIDFNLSLAVAQHIHNNSRLCYFWTTKTSFNHTSHTRETVKHNSIPQLTCVTLCSDMQSHVQAYFILSTQHDSD